MKRMLLILAAGAFLTLAAPHGAWAFGKKDVVSMTRAGIPDSLIIEKIRHSEAIFSLKTKDIEALRAEGVSDRVIAAMLRTEDRQPRQGRYYREWGWPYDTPWDMGFGFYDPFYDFYAPPFVITEPGHVQPSVVAPPASGRTFHYGFRRR